jgi:hypothetical protein
LGVRSDRPKKKRPKLSPIDYAERFTAEKKLQQRRYCDAFELWRDCRHKLCRHHRCCRGDADKCLAEAVALDRVPHRMQWRTRQDILEATPFNIGAPERAARQCMPIDFYLKRRSGI